MIKKLLFTAVMVGLVAAGLLSCSQPFPLVTTPAPTPIPTATLGTTQAPNPADVEWLAKVIASEAGSVWDSNHWVACTEEERAAVGCTLINRLSAGTYGGSIEEIASAPGQYAHNQSPTLEISALAERLLEGQIPDPTGGATHFFSPISMPKEGESTTGFDVGGGLHQVSGITERVYFPSWTEQLTWVGELVDVRTAYFMFYRPVSMPPTSPFSSLDLERPSFAITLPLRDINLVSIKVEGHNNNPSKQIFIGLAAASDLANYLAGVNYDEITGFRINPYSYYYVNYPGNSAPAAPYSRTFWVVSEYGSGTQTLEWTLESRDWILVLMNADGSAGISLTVTIGSTQTISVATSGLANSPWPMFGHDPQHTGRSPYIGPSSPKVKWSYSLGRYLESAPAIGPDGTIYIGSADNSLYALKPDGTLKWKYSTGGSISSSPSIGADGTIYVGSRDYNLYAINPDGALKWSYPTGGVVFSSPTIGADGTVYVGSRDNNLYAINPSGTLKWSYPAGDVDASPAIGVDGTIYAGSANSKLYALNPNGILKWSYTTGGVISSSSPAIGADGTIYVGSWDKNLYALNPNGTLKWSYGTGDMVDSTPAISSDGTIYIGSWDNNVYALNPNGTLKWSYTTGHWVAAAPTIGADGTIYQDSTDNILYALNPDGTLKWRFSPGSSYSSSQAIAADGTIYIGSRNEGILYAIGATQSMKIDGTISPGEWSDAAYIDFTVAYPNGTPCAIRLYAKNDVENLYMAVTAQDTWLGYVLIRFDKNRDGVVDSLGDDYLFIQGNPAAQGSYDGVMVNSYGGGNQDTVAGGTNDVTAATTHSKLNGLETTVFELMRPLDTKDDAHDIILHPGETINFRIEYSNIAMIWPRSGLARLVLSDSRGSAPKILYP
jgi:outer membrane protein assembly factor BamB